MHTSPSKRCLQKHNDGCHLQTEESVQVETNKDKQLQRRVQSLQRFLMTRLKAELAQRAPRSAV